uniref:DUF4537 domain-containing protein n=1 Tax=Callorhinchus milii TaxID=7868 RepID=A0A4W3JH58_CALMI
MRNTKPPSRYHITSRNKPTNQARQVLDTLKGQRVIARSEINGFYYPGVVSKCISSRKAIVHFTKGETQITPTEFIIQTGGATPCPPLKVGDFVLVRTNEEGEYYRWVTGVIIATPQSARKDDKFYTVLKYNNRKEHTLRRGLNKISKTQYIFTCRYMKETQMADRTM